MGNLSKLIISCLILIHIQACKKNPAQLIKVEEVSAWCIIGFDALERTPEQRIALLKEMDIKKYGYNRGKGDYSLLKHEFKLAKENNIEISSVFVWLNANRDSIGKLSDANEKLLTQLKEVDQKPAIWVSFSNNYFENIDDQKSIQVAVDMIKYIKSRTDDLGCQLALYNHTGWFAKPQNQINIIKEIGLEDISMVYNFHHAQGDVDEFSESVKMIKPYLSYVNLNGVKKEGPKIVDIGKGDHEYEMINKLIKEGYDGPWGILGHIKTEDVKVVLERNIEGLKSLNTRFKNSTK